MTSLKQINFSVHSFRDNFPSSSLGPYLERIMAFSRRLLSERPEVYINYRLWNLGGGDKALQGNEEVYKMVEDYFSVKIPQDVDVSVKKSHRLTGRLYLHFDSRFVWPSLNFSELNQKGHCHGLGTHIGVHADGTVVPCCLDKEANLALGNLHQQDLADILASPRAVKMRQGFRDGKLVEDLCKRCSYIQRFQKE